MTDQRADIDAVATAIWGEPAYRPAGWEVACAAAIEALRPFHAAAPVQVGEIVVEQCDRDRAADWLRENDGLTWGAARRVHMREGHHDDNPLVQAFARHRLAAEAKVRIEAYEDAAGWQPIETAPKDRTYILALVSGASGTWEYLNGRCFVIRHGGVSGDYDLGWDVFPGFGGAPDNWFAGWQPLPAILQRGGEK